MHIAYAPHPDGEPDPGEIVWSWVPYEDDPSQGKDHDGDQQRFDAVVAALRPHLPGHGSDDA